MGPSQYPVLRSAAVWGLHADADRDLHGVGKHHLGNSQELQPTRHPLLSRAHHEVLLQLSVLAVLDNRFLSCGFPRIVFPEYAPSLVALI